MDINKQKIIHNITKDKIDIAIEIFISLALNSNVVVYTNIIYNFFKENSL